MTQLVKLKIHISMEYENIASSTTFYVFSYFESNKIWAAGLVVGELCESPSHWNKRRSLHQWLCEQV